MGDLLVPVAVIALLLALLAIVLAGLLSLQGGRQLRQQQVKHETLQGDLRALVNAAVQVGERLNRAEQQIKLLQQRQQELGVRQERMVQAEPDGRSFDQAIKLARKGASAEELMEICELSRGEAELIAMMHRLDHSS